MHADLDLTLVMTDLVTDRLSLSPFGPSEQKGEDRNIRLSHPPPPPSSSTATTTITITSITPITQFTTTVTWTTCGRMSPINA